MPVGDPKQCHAVAIDGRAPKFDGGIITRLDCLPLGIVVNREGVRFYDEGEELVAEALCDLGTAGGRSSRARSHGRSSIRKWWGVYAFRFSGGSRRIRSGEFAVALGLPAETR